MIYEIEENLEPITKKRLLLTVPVIIIIVLIGTSALKECASYGSSKMTTTATVSNDAITINIRRVEEDGHLILTYDKHDGSVGNVIHASEADLDLLVKAIIQHHNTCTIEKLINGGNNGKGILDANESSK